MASASGKRERNWVSGPAALGEFGRGRKRLLQLRPIYAIATNFRSMSLGLKKAHELIDKTSNGLLELGGYDALDEPTKKEMRELRSLVKTIIDHYELRTKYPGSDHNYLLDQIPVTPEDQAEAQAPARARNLAALSSHLDKLKAMWTLDPMGNGVQDRQQALDLVKGIVSKLGSLDYYREIPLEVRQALQESRWYMKALIGRHQLEEHIPLDTPSRLIPHEDDVSPSARQAGLTRRDLKAGQRRNPVPRSSPDMTAKGPSIPQGPRSSSNTSSLRSNPKTPPPRLRLDQTQNVQSPRKPSRTSLSFSSIQQSNEVADRQQTGQDSTTINRRADQKRRR